MTVFKFYGASLVGVLSLALTGCLGKNLADHPDLLSASAHCNDVEDFGACLLSSYVNHPAAMSFPEKLEFSPYYAQIIQTGYNREERRKNINKYVDKDIHEKQNNRAFEINDMNLYARLKTPDGTRKAISILKNEEKFGVRHLDPALERWLEDPTVFDNDFVTALLLRYSENWMQKSTVWDRSGMMPGKSSFEVLSRSFEKIGDKPNAEKMIADMRQQRFYPLRETLKPVYLGRKKLTRMNGPALKKAGFSAMAIMPLINQQIESGVKPSLVFSNLAFAIRHGHGDNRGDEIVEKALNYAYERNDKRSIIRFADQILSMPETFSNDMSATFKRADRISQDLILVRYLLALGDYERIKKVAQKWDPLSTPLPNGKLPSWTGTSTFNYTKILHHADRSSHVKKYIQAWEGKLIHLNDDAEFITTMSSKAVSLPILKTIEAKAVQEQSGELMERFYIKCANDSGVSMHKYEVRNYCLSKVQSSPKRIDAQLKLAKTMYDEGKNELGRELVMKSLSDAAACTCIEEKAFSNQSYHLADIILSELGNEH